MDSKEWLHALKYAAMQRDRRLRRHLLTALYKCLSSPSGWTGAIKLQDIVNGLAPPDQGFEDDEHCLGLLRQLQIKGLIEERKTPRRRDERFGLRHVEYRILALGLSLHNESAPPDPDIDDDRVE
jgi:hypothetical protein